MDVKGALRPLLPPEKKEPGLMLILSNSWLNRSRKPQLQMNRQNAPKRYCARAKARSVRTFIVKMAAAEVGKKFCPHCNRWLSRTAYVEHRALYYNKDTCAWSTVSLVSGCSCKLWHVDTLLKALLSHPFLVLAYHADYSHSLPICL